MKAEVEDYIFDYMEALASRVLQGKGGVEQPGEYCRPHGAVWQRLNHIMCTAEKSLGNPVDDLTGDDSGFFEHVNATDLGRFHIVQFSAHILKLIKFFCTQNEAAASSAGFHRNVSAAGPSTQGSGANSL